MKLHFKSASGSPTGPGKAAGKGCGTLFFGLFFAMGMLFVVFLLGEAFRTAAPWFWEATDCTIISSGVSETGDDEHPYLPRAHFSYEFDGTIRESRAFYRNYKGTSSYDRARDWAAPYPEGSHATCYVSPDQPALAVLERRQPWIVLLVLFPMIFVAIGAGGLWAVWKATPDAEDDETQSISQKAAGGRGQKVMLVVGLIFTVVGGAIFVPLFALPITRLAISLSWNETPCTIVYSGIRSWETDDGSSHRADVHYDYESGGRMWRSNTVDFFSIVTTGRKDARAVRDRHPRGESRTCYVSSRDPSKSVLERQFRLKHLLGGIPVIFLIAGLALTKHGLKKLRRGSDAKQAIEEEEEKSRDPIILEPTMGPMGKVFGTLFFALFWNGIVSIFLWQVVKSWRRGDPEWFHTFFLIPFVLVGIASIIFVFYFLLATANPRPRISLASGQPRLGDTVQIEWFFSGRASRIGHLEITLEGREEATYQRGTNTYTEKEVFATHTLVDTRNDWEIPQGSALVLLPDDTMHSLAADNNKIIWEIKVSGDIRRWPDIDEALPITVKPLPIEVL